MEAYDRLQAVAEEQSAEIEEAGNTLIVLQKHLENRLAEITRLEDEAEREKKKRMYYQNIVYAVCNMIDRWRGVPATGGKTVCCGTAVEPCREVQDGVEAMGAEIKQLQDRLHTRVNDVIGANRERRRAQNEYEDEFLAHAETKTEHEAEVEQLKDELRIQKGTKMETYAALLRACADRLEQDFAKNAASVMPDVQRVLAGLADASIDGDSVSPNLPNPPLVVIENLPKLGVSAKYEMPALRSLSHSEFCRFAEVMCGIVLEASRRPGDNPARGSGTEIR